MSAFNKWFKMQYEADPKAAISYLFQCTVLEQDSIVWDYLEKTGDTTYTNSTFEKAAKLIVEDAG